MIFNLRAVSLVVVIINSGVVANEVQLDSPYGGTNVTVSLHSSVTFKWTFSGGLLEATWATKRKDALDIDQVLMTIGMVKQQIFNVSLYNGRVNGSWNGKSPGQVSFTLSPIKEVDNRFFLCIFKPIDFGVLSTKDTVQLIVQDPPMVTFKTSILPARRGVPARLTCNASGFPDPKISWMRQTGPTESEIDGDNGNYQINSQPGSSELILKKTMVNDQGYYLCKASNFKSDVTRAYIGVLSLYVDYDLCPTSTEATIGESKTICCPVKGFPPPDITWQLPNGTFLKSEGINLRVALKEGNDFGRYRCIAQGVEEKVATEVTIHQKDVKPEVVIIDNITFILNPGDKFSFMLGGLPKAPEYLFTIHDTKSTKEISLLGGNDTSVEIPHSSLVFKSANVDERPREVKVIIDVQALSKRGIREKIYRFIDVDIRASATSFTVSLMTLLLSHVISSSVGLCCVF
ncbi:hemicentin-1-like [Stylophora pistillata]|uniref:hemicentin-1-like n=1 Tax=Stylophora pistillata TaxID=50429 RepID=UPI000C03AAAC|nr:hemicentin-1-like [Stylophora pistillata]